MSLFLLVLLIMGAYFVVGAGLAVVAVACWLWIQERRDRALLDRAAVAQEWEDGELIEEWTRMIDVLSPLAFIRADEVADD